MIGKVKTLTVALVAVCAFGVSSASAAEFHIAGMGTVTGHGTQFAASLLSFGIPEIKPENSLQCANAVLNVHTATNASGIPQETTAQTATVKVEEPGSETPETLKCTYAALPGSTLHMNGCDFLVHSGPPIQTTVKCPAGQQIKFTVFFFGTVRCTIHVPEQGELQGFTITNNAEDIDLTAAVQGIKFQSTQGVGAGSCISTVNGINGQLVGKVTVQGTAGKVASKLQYA